MAHGTDPSYAYEYTATAADDYLANAGYTGYDYRETEGDGVEGDDAAAAGAEWGGDDAYPGYVYDPASGEWVSAEGAEGAASAAIEGSYFALDEVAPTSPFGDEAYWQQYGEDAVDETPVAPVDVGDADAPVEATGVGTGDAAVDTGEAPATPEMSVPAPPSASSLAARGGAVTAVITSTPPAQQRKKKAKTKQERVQMRQAQLEKDEAETQEERTDQGPADAPGKPGSPGKASEPATTSKTRTEPPRAPAFLERERAKVRLRLRKLRAVRRKRMPPQVRILTATRAHLSPLEIYFGGSVEAALSDVFWAAIKGDLRRVRFLVEVEKVSVVDATLDPWHMEQTPLHWAAKGGDAAVIEYLLQAGANPRSLDENGSLPLHLACWAGHVDATLALLRATDTRDLYVQDYDAALAPLDWAQLRGHTTLVQAIERYEDAKWLPKFVDDLVRGIIRYKIKLYKEPLKPLKSPTRGIQFRRAGGGGGGDAERNQNQNQTTEDASAKPPETSKTTGDTDKVTDHAVPAPESAISK